MFVHSIFFNIVEICFNVPLQGGRRGGKNSAAKEGKKEVILKSCEALTQIKKN